MGKYLKLFGTTSAYETYINGDDAVLPNVSFCEDEREAHYNPYVHYYSKDYFTIVVTTGGDVTWTGKSSNALSYSTDNGTTWSTASSNITLSVNEGDKILWKGTPTQLNSGIGTFSGGTDVRYSVEGNVMSLLFGDNFKGQTSLGGKDYALHQLFYNNTNITSAENLSLPATTLANNCYYFMFYGCTNLTTAPSVLPATTLAKNCYYGMFFNCTNLTTAPELPTTTLAEGCYDSMFRGCTGLTTAPELPATTLAKNCYYGMFFNCTNLTTAPSVLPATTLAEGCCRSMFYGCTSLTTAPELPATSLANSCYNSMFYNCTGLTTAPELPATTLANNCYYHMFNGCTILSSIKCLATDKSASYCTDAWVSGVAASGTFTKAASMSRWSTGTSGIPSGWTVVDA